LVTSLLLHVSNNFGVVGPCTVLLGAIIPVIMRKIAGLIPNCSQYIRHAARSHSIGRALGAHVAWYAKYCTPLTTKAEQASAGSFDIPDLNPIAPYSICTMEMALWTFMIQLEEIIPWHFTPVLHAMAYRFAHFNPASMDHLFAFKNLDTGHPAQHDLGYGVSEQFQTCIGPHNEIKVYTFGTTPADFGRQSTDDMPEFWRNEEQALERMGKSLTDAWGIPSLSEHTVFDKTSDALIDPNYILIHYKSKLGFMDRLYETLGDEYKLEREWITEVIEVFRSNPLLRLPILQTGIAKNDRLKWQTVDCYSPATNRLVGKKVVVQEISIFRQDNTNCLIRMSTVFLWLFQHRYLRMNALSSAEDHFTRSGSKWVLPFPVKGECGLLQVFTRQQQPNRYLYLDNPFYNSAASTDGDLLSAQWIGNMMNSHVKKYIKQQTSNRMAIFGAQQSVVEQVQGKIIAAQISRRENLDRMCQRLSVTGEVAVKSALSNATASQRRILFCSMNPDDDAYLHHWSDELSVDAIMDTAPTRVELRLKSIISYLEDIESATNTSSGAVLYPMRAINTTSYPDDLCINRENDEAEFEIRPVIRDINMRDDAPGGGDEDHHSSKRGEKRNIADDESNLVKYPCTEDDISEYAPDPTSRSIMDA